MKLINEEAMMVLSEELKTLREEILLKEKKYQQAIDKSIKKCHDALKILAQR